MRLDEGVAIDDIVAGAEAYRALCRAEGRAGRFVKAAHSWLVGGGWKDVKAPDKPGAATADKTCIGRDDPRWPALEQRYRQTSTRHKGPPSDCNSWFFPNAWVKNSTELVSA